MLAPDDGAGGGGGGSAVADPPAAPANPSQDIIDFQAPDIHDVTEAIKTGGEPPDPATPPVKPDPKTPEPKPDPKPDPKAPKGGEPPAAQLRRELEASKSELAELKKKLEAGDPRLVEAQNAVKAKETEILDVRKRAEELERRVMMQDPNVNGKLREMDESYNRDAGKFYQRVPELDAGTFQALTTEYFKLPFGKEGYKEARAAFEQKVNERLGAEEGRDHRKLEQVMAFIERTHDFAHDREKLSKEVSTNARKLYADGQKKHFTTKVERVKSILSKAGEVPEDMASTNPLHPKVLLKNFDSVLTPEQIAAFDKGIEGWIQLVVAGVSPRSEEDYTGMTPEQIAESQREEAARVETARDHAVDVMYNGLRAMRRIPYLIKELQKARARLKEINPEPPPDPTSGEAGGNNPAPDDIRNFQAPDLSKVQF